jgi:Xaa-Pro aminopeptidase
MPNQSKRSRLDAYLKTNELESVWLATPHLFAWFTGGSNLVERAGQTGVAAVGYDGTETTVVTTNIEAQRLLDEELEDGMPVEASPWHETGIEAAVADRAKRPAAADFAWPGFDRVDRTAITQPLTESDIEQYRKLSRDTASVVESVARRASPTDTEQSLAGSLHGELQSQGIESTVVLVGGQERLQEYRHFTPQPVAIGAYAVLTVVGVRNGLNAAVTRTVAFEDAPDRLHKRYEDMCRVAATAYAATQEAGRTGGQSGDVFSAIKEAYEELEYPSEWTNHHQGGALGTLGREWIGTPGGEEPISLPMTYAWNPTAVGVKNEETVLVTENRIEVLSKTGAVPTRTVDAVDFDVELTVTDVLWR